MRISRMSHRPPTRQKSPAERVGYGKPPRATRFRKGESGNPAGRPKGIKPLNRVLEEALAQNTTVRVAGRARAVTKLEALTRKLADLAVDGDARALRLLLGEIREAESRAAETPDVRDVLTTTDHEVIAALVLRIGGGR